MSSISTPITFLDLYTDLMNRTREDTSIAATIVQAKRYINVALQDMHLGTGEKFPWAESRATIQTIKKRSDGTVAIIKGTRTVTGTGTAFGNILPGDKLTVDGRDEVYELVSGSAIAQTAILTTAFIGDTVTEASYVHYRDEYRLANDFLRPIDQQSFDENRSIDLVGRTEFRRRYPRNSRPGKPRVGSIVTDAHTPAKTGSFSATSGGSAGFTTVTTIGAHGLAHMDPVTITGTSQYNGVYGVTTSDLLGASAFSIPVYFSISENGTWTRPSSSVKKLRLSPPPEELKYIPYAYVTSNLVVQSDETRARDFVNDTDEPIVPVQYRHAIVYHALAKWYRDKKDDAREASAAADYASSMTRIISDQEIGEARAQFRPRITNYRRAARRPWHGGGGRYDTGGRFDRFEV